MPDDNGQSAAPVTAYPPNSRYYRTETSSFADAAGRQIVYLQRRFLPRPDAFQVLFEHAVVAGDRLDLLAAEHLGDPLLFWRLCDANGAMRPNELLDEANSRPGEHRIAITLPENMQGAEL